MNHYGPKMPSEISPVSQGGRTQNPILADVFAYIERFYNQQRRHSMLDYHTTLEYDQQGSSG